MHVYLANDNVDRSDRRILKKKISNQLVTREDLLSRRLIYSWSEMVSLEFLCGFSTTFWHRKAVQAYAHILQKRLSSISDHINDLFENWNVNGKDGALRFSHFLGCFAPANRNAITS